MRLLTCMRHQTLAGMQHWQVCNPNAPDKLRPRDVDINTRQSELEACLVQLAVQTTPLPLPQSCQPPTERPPVRNACPRTLHLCEARLSPSSQLRRPSAERMSDCGLLSRCDHAPIASYMSRLHASWQFVRAHPTTAAMSINVRHDRTHLKLA